MKGYNELMEPYGVFLCKRNDGTLIQGLDQVDVISLMKEAQIESLKELMKRENLWLMGTDERSKSIYGAINNAILQLIKELES